MLKNTSHLALVKLDFEVGLLEILHARELVICISDQLFLCSFNLVLLVFKYRQFVKKALPAGFVYSCDLIETVRNVLDHLMKLFSIDLEYDTSLAHTFDRVRVSTHPGHIL